MNELQAALGLVVLDYVEEEREKRKALEVVYREKLSDVEGVSFLPELPGVRRSYQYFVIRIEKNTFGMSRDSLCAELKKYNIFARKYFYPLCSKYPCYRDLKSSGAENLPVANRIQEEVLVMPFYGKLMIEIVEKICNIVSLCQKQTQK